MRKISFHWNTPLILYNCKPMEWEQSVQTTTIRERFDKELLDSAPSFYILEQNLIFIEFVYVRTFDEIKDFSNIIFLLLLSTRKSHTKIGAQVDFCEMVFIVILITLNACSIQFNQILLYRHILYNIIVISYLMCSRKVVFEIKND